MTTTLFNTTVLTPTEIMEKSAIVISDEGKIIYVGSMKQAPMTDGSRIDLRKRIVIPGLIDVHVHGGNGVSFGIPESLSEDLEAYSRWVVQTGVTGFLLSISAPDAESLTSLVDAYAELLNAGVPAAEALGLHLEGPFLSLEKKGAFNPEWIRDPMINEAESFLAASQGWIRQITLAPELPRAEDVASLFVDAGVVVSLGHTNADYDTASAALRNQWTHVTHTFNAQRGFGHRSPGVFGAILASDGVTAELIADNFHVHPGAMKILLRSLGADRIVLITDAMPGAGLADGTYDLVGHKVTVKDGQARLDNGTIAGSTVLMNECVRNFHREVGVSLREAVQMATLNPARAMRMADEVGVIAVGRDANLVVIDEDVNVYLTMVNGEIVHTEL